jgi:hypothetical protein
VSDGTRTRDFLDHNQVLYQLSYTHHRVSGRSWRQLGAYRAGVQVPIGVSQDVGGLRDAATAWASSLVGPGGGTNRV